MYCICFGFGGWGLGQKWKMAGRLFFVVYNHRGVALCLLRARETPSLATAYSHLIDSVCNVFWGDFLPCLLYKPTYSLAEFARDTSLQSS